MRNLWKPYNATPELTGATAPQPRAGVLLARRHRCGEYWDKSPKHVLIQRITRSVRGGEYVNGLNYARESGTPPQLRNRSRAFIIVFDADDVILAEITAGLDLDQFQQDLAGVFQPVDGTDRDVDRFVLVHGLDGFVDRHPRGAAHHDPVLGAMVVLLQRQPPARLHHDALDLVALADVARLIGPPGPMPLEMILGHLRRHGLELRPQPLQPVGILLARDQHGILRRHYHQIVDALQRHQRPVGRDVAVARIL